MSDQSLLDFSDLIIFGWGKMCFEGKKDQWEVVIIAKNKVFQEHKVVEITKLKDTPWYEHNISKKMIIILLQWHLLTKSKHIFLIL